MIQRKLYDIYDAESKSYLAKSKTTSQVSDLTGMRTDAVRKYADGHAKYKDRYIIVSEGESIKEIESAFKTHTFPSKLLKDWDDITSKLRDVFSGNSKTALKVERDRVAHRFVVTRVRL